MAGPATRTTRSQAGSSAPASETSSTATKRKRAAAASARVDKADKASRILQPVVEDAEEDDVYEAEGDIPAPIAKAFEGIARMLQGFGDRLDDMSNMMGDGRRSVRREEEDDEDPFAPPFRGHHGKCDPISIRYAYLDQKIRDAALAGNLAPESLAALIPPTSPLYRAPATVSGPGFLQSPSGLLRPAEAPARSQSDIVRKFMVDIPNPTVFAFAWNILINLMIHGMGSLEEAGELHTAMNWYLTWIMERSVRVTWESLCRYHIRVCAKRFAGVFHTSQWYEVVDHNASLDLEFVSSAPTSFPAPLAPSMSGFMGAKPSASKRRVLAKDKRDVTAEPCFRWNTTFCKDPCRDGRRHSCQSCGKGHKVADCK